MAVKTKNKKIKPLVIKRAPEGIATGYTDTGLYLNNRKIRSWLTIHILKIRNDRLTVCGSHMFNNIGTYDCFFRDSAGHTYEIIKTGSAYKCYDEQSGLSLETQYFEVEIDLAGVDSLEFCAALTEKESAEGLPQEIVPVITYGKHGKLAGGRAGTYYAHGRYIVTKEKNTLKICKGSIRNLIKNERIYGEALRRETGSARLAFIRLAALILKLLKRREIWIICDRDDAAGDNGEALFKYLVSKENNAKLYFAIGRDCPDYQRMRRYGKVLAIGSLRYYIKYLIADKVISSQTGEWVTDPFGGDGKYMKSMYDFDYVFLQHGIILNDLSGWFTYYKKDISLFITSAEREYEAVSHYGYCCNENTVRLTGLPRFDYLHDDAKKKIVFMPTWRKDIAGPAIPGTAHREYSDQFKRSAYYRFYDGLINSPELLACMKKFGYTGELYIHPAFTVQARDFHGNDIIKVSESVAKYNKVLADSALMVTDYSSAVFDFAYLKKPVVYTQFDADEFYTEHHCGQGYFDYKTDGFGPVCYNKEDAVEALVKYIESGCTMEEEYRKRADGFFAFNDKDNCKRVHAEISKL